MKAVFYWRLSSIEGRLSSKVFFHRSLSSIICLPLEFVFHQKLSPIIGRLPLKVVFPQRCGSCTCCCSCCCSCSCSSCDNPKLALAKGVCQYFTCRPQPGHNIAKLSLNLTQTKAEVSFIFRQIQPV